MTRMLAYLPPFLALALVTSCNTTSPVAADAPATFAAINAQVFTNCTTSSCHGAAGARGSLVLTPDTAYDQLVGVPADNPNAKAKGKVRVKAGDPANSYLLQKLEGSMGADEGSTMPNRGAKLSAEQIDLVRRWIAAGAPK